MVRIRADVSGLLNGVRSAQQSVANFDKEVRKSAAKRQAINDLGTSFGKVGLAAAAGLGLSAKAAMDWETAWAGVTKTTSGSTAQMAALESELRGLAKTLPTTHAEIAAVAEAAGQLGVKRQDIAAFTKTMIDLGQSTNLSADEAATSIAQMANVMGTAPSEIDNLGAALVALGNNGASTERDIIQMSQRIAGAAKVVGASESDVLAISNAVASMGIDVEAGGTAVSRVFATMSQAATSGGKRLEAFAKISGVSASQFAKAFKEDAAGGLVTFIKGLEKTQKAGGDLYGQLKAVGLSDIRVSQALIGMASSGDLLTDSLELGSKAWQENTALTKEADKRYATTASRVRVAANRIKDDMIQVGDAILPVIAEMTEHISGMADAFGDLPAPLKDTIVKALALTAALGGGVFVLSRAITGYANFRNNLTLLGETMADVNKKQMLMRGGALVAGIGLIALSDKARKSDDSLGDLTQTLGYAATGFAIGGPIGAAIGALTGIATASGNTSKKFDSGRASVKEYAATFDGLSASITKATRAQAFDDLTKTNALKAASALGIANRDLVGFTLGNEDATRRVNIQLDKYQKLLIAGKDVPMISLANGGQVDAVNALSQALGLVTPKIAKGRAEALTAARATATWSEALRGLPKGVQVELKNLNYAPTTAEIESLRKKYNLTPKQVKTILKAIDNASGPIGTVQRARDRLQDKTITITTIRRTIREFYDASKDAPSQHSLSEMLQPYTGMRLPTGYAGGGVVPGSAPADPTVDNVWARGANTGRPLMVRSGEWIINEKQSKANDAWLRWANSGGNFNDLFGRAQGFAGGGTQRGSSTSQTPGRPSISKADLRDVLREVLPGLEFGLTGTVGNQRLKINGA